MWYCVKKFYTANLLVKVASTRTSCCFFIGHDAHHGLNWKCKSFKIYTVCNFLSPKKLLPYHEGMERWGNRDLFLIIKKLITEREEAEHTKNYEAERTKNLPKVTRHQWELHQLHRALKIMGSHNPGTTLINKGKEMFYTQKKKHSFSRPQSANPWWLSLQLCLCKDLTHVFSMTPCVLELIFCHTCTLQYSFIPSPGAQYTSLHHLISFTHKINPIYKLPKWKFTHTIPQIIDFICLMPILKMGLNYPEVIFFS